MHDIHELDHFLKMAPKLLMHQRRWLSDVDP